MKDDTVEVLVRIPKRDFEELQSNYVWWGKHGEYIKKGTVLPKGHGDLKDYGAIKSDYIRKMSVFMSEEERMDLLCTIVDEAEVVIEADRVGDTDGNS